MIMDDCAFIYKLIEDLYSFRPDDVSRVRVGVGGDTFVVRGVSRKYILKIVEKGSMQRPDDEPKICALLGKNGVPVPEYIQNAFGSKFAELDEGRYCHLQTYIEGDHYRQNTLPERLLDKSASMLAMIHSVMSGMPPLPVALARIFSDTWIPTGRRHHTKIRLRPRGGPAWTALPGKSSSGSGSSRG